MNNFDDKISADSEHQQLLSQRAPIASNPDLAGRIIDATAAMPQDDRESSNATYDFSQLQPARETSLIKQISRFIEPVFSTKPMTAVAVAVGVAVVLNSGFWAPEQAVPQISAVPDSPTLISDVELTTEEFSWEELLLLQDEIAFAQL